MGNCLCTQNNYSREKEREDIIRIRTSLDAIQRSLNRVLSIVKKDDAVLIERAKKHLERRSL